MVTNDLGREADSCVRERVITLYRLVVSLPPVMRWAESRRWPTFNALFATTVAYRSFHNQLAKRTFSDKARSLTLAQYHRVAVLTGPTRTTSIHVV